MTCIDRSGMGRKRILTEICFKFSSHAFGPGDWRTSQSFGGLLSQMEAITRASALQRERPQEQGIPTLVRKKHLPIYYSIAQQNVSKSSIFCWRKLQVKSCHSRCEIFSYRRSEQGWYRPSNWWVVDVPIYRYTIWLKRNTRGGDRASRYLSHSSQRKFTKGYSSRSSELLL